MGISFVRFVISTDVLSCFIIKALKRVNFVFICI